MNKFLITLSVLGVIFFTACGADIVPEMPSKAGTKPTSANTCNATNGSIYQVDGIETLTCTAGQQVSGNASRQCRSDGTWSQSLGSCVTASANTCTGVNDSTHPVNSTEALSCPAGQQISGNASRLCQSDGTWSQSLGTCVTPSANTCTGTNGSIHSVDGTETLTCAAGQQVSGNASRQCRSDGTWSQSLGTCVTPSVFTLASTAFANNDAIAPTYQNNFGAQCSGENQSPPLAWSNPPANTQSYAITMIDTDADNFVHWMAWNIPSTTTSLVEGVSARAGASFVQGFNEFSSQLPSLGYGGPCPPSGSGTHRYQITLYALSSELTRDTLSPTTATIEDFTAAVAGITLGTAQLVGTVTKP